MATSTYSFRRLNGPDVLNTVTTGSQDEPTVVATSGGAAIVFFDAGDTIAARRLDASGEPTGAQVTVSAGVGATEPEATRLANGNVVVTWQDGSGDTKTLGRIYSPDLTSVSGILTFEGAAGFDYRQPDIAATPDGGFVVVSTYVFSGTDEDIYIRKFTAAGALADGEFFSPGSTIDRNPSVAVLPNGNVAVAWERLVGSETEVWSAFYNSALTEIRAPALLDTIGTINKNVSVAARPDNTFTVSYEDSFSGNDNVTTYQFDTAGLPTTFDVTASNSGAEKFPNAATSVEGYQVVVAEDVTTPTWDVSAAVLTPTGVVGGLNTILEGGGGFQYRPDVAWINSSTFQLAYSTFNSETGGDGSSNGIAVSRFSVVHTQTGNGTNETITTDGLRDSVDGGGGFDTVVMPFAFGGAAVARVGGTTFVTSGGTQDTLTNVERVQFTDRLLSLSPNRQDFNADAFGDVLYQNANGQAAVWTTNGLAAVTGGLVGGNIGPTWNLISSGDFDRNGRSDFLWQNDSGQAAVWSVDGFAFVAGGLIGGNPGPSWHVIDAGDFDGDGVSDILWQNDNGQAAVWITDGLAFESGGSAGGNPGPSWHVRAAGDFDGDGKSDILWQNDDGQAAVWLMNGTTFVAGGSAGGNPGPSWNVIDAGDFNGDGRADILWQNDDGQAAVWLMNGTTFVAGGPAGGNPGTSWRVQRAEDMNADGRADIVWRHDDGSVAVWTMNGTNFVAGAVIGNPGADWDVI